MSENFFKSADGRDIVDIYIDESSQTKHRYLVLGGMSISKKDAQEAEEVLRAARFPELPKGELKWGKISRAKLAAYLRFVDQFFDHRVFKNSSFHSLVVDTQKVDNSKFDSGSREVGFNKEIYQLASKFARLDRKPVFHLYLDSRETNQKPDDLRNILNHGMHKKNDGRDWPFRHCQFRDSAKSSLIQLVDLLSGVVAYGENEHFRAKDASPAKRDFARHVWTRAGLPGLHKDTAMRGKFTLWHRMLRK